MSEDRPSRRARALAGLALLALLTLLLPAATTGSAGTAPEAAVVEEVAAKGPAAVREYWTPKRMREAKPIELLREGAVRRDGAASLEPEGAPELALPAKPGIAQPAGGEEGLVESLLPPLGVREQRRAEQVNNSTRYPNRTHGKVFGTFSGEDFVCSATVVHSLGRKLVITAGHCVFDAGISDRWANNWMFAPGYRDGQRPFGSWPAQKFAAAPGWVHSASSSFDIGAAVLARDRQGRGVETVVGSRGIAFNQSRNQKFKAFGYPSEQTLFRRDFTGGRLFACTSERTGSDNPPGSGPDTIEIRCDMTSGASGGGWVIDGRAVNSVISYAFITDANHLYGPYFGKAAKNLYLGTRGRLNKCLGVPVTNLGTPRDDEFGGTGGRDSMKLRGGNDTAEGRGGRDFLCGGPGDDVLRGGRGDDVLRGGRGHDVCIGGPGNDRAFGCEVARGI